MSGKAIIAMSGGVDSSVAAFLALRQGLDCAGVTMNLFDSVTADGSGAAGGAASRGRNEKTCCSLSDVNDARDVAAKLGMPHYILNLKKEFEHNVIQKFVRVYEEGGTPNPCIDCNRYLKFNALLLRTLQLDFDFLVTGHYARVEKQNGRFLLLKGHDTKKDQSYVLAMMTQTQLSRALFPLGGLTKDEVRAIANEQKFINAHKKDSQDICFVPDGDYGAFIENYTGKKFSCGNILDINGGIIGEHKGYIRYTKGQRRGIGVSAGAPLYVCDKSPLRNTITLGSELSLYSKSLTANELNLIACAAITKPLRVTVKTRYMQREEPATAEQTAPDTIRIEFDNPQRAVTAGQSAVLYSGDVVIAGATIYAPV